MTDDGLLRVTVDGVQQHQQEFLLVLRDEFDRELAIPIGICEFTSVQRALDDVKAERPLTHDLFLTLCEDLHATPERVIIDDYSHGTYYARLLLRGPDAEPIVLDCRPSDGITLVLRAHGEVYVTEMVMSGEEHH